MSFAPKSFLVIQTAFIGDVILATALVEKLKEKYPEASIDFLLRKGNEDLFRGHPFIRAVIIWVKKKDKIKNLFAVIKAVRANRYDCIVNVHRFASSGLITAFSGSKLKIGFDKNPLSFLFDVKVKHKIGDFLHEVDRNQLLIKELTDELSRKPKLYLTSSDVEKVNSLLGDVKKYICIAPTSVWFTKQFPKEKWIELINELNDSIVLLGASSDYELCEFIKVNSKHQGVLNLAGKLSFLESAALMKGAVMNYVNDSAPMHLASAVNAPVTAIYCSTTPAFGFGPLSDRSSIMETKESLSCRPCGLHGFKACPQGHFKCAYSIEIRDLKRVMADPS